MGSDVHSLPRRDFTGECRFAGRILPPAVLFRVDESSSLRAFAFVILMCTVPPLTKLLIVASGSAAAGVVFGRTFSGEPHEGFLGTCIWVRSAEHGPHGNSIFVDHGDHPSYSWDAFLPPPSDYQNPKAQCFVRQEMTMSVSRSDITWTPPSPL